MCFSHALTVGTTTAGTYGLGAEPTWLDEVTCTGTECSVESCTHAGWGMENCGHTEDVAIKCGNFGLTLSIVA